MSAQQFRLPDLGEGLTEAELVSWLVSVGDVITLNQAIAEVETEKAVVELPSPFAGTVTALLAEAGATVAVGSPIIAIETGDHAPDTVGDGSERGVVAPARPAEEKVEVLVGYGPSAAPASRRHRRGRSGPAPAAAPPTPPMSTRPLAKPPVRYMARVKGVDLTEVRGTGPGGTITRQDVDQHVEAVSSPTLVSDDRETRVPIRGVRKHTAAAMVRSAFTAPHVTEFVTVDVTPAMELVERLREHQLFDGVRLTSLAVVAKALLLALRDNPSLNSSWDEECQEIVTKHYVNLGIAAATDRGLIVPNIKDAQSMTLRQLAASLGDLTATARAGTTTPADLTGGTITITNIGVFGIDGGTPILNPGEAAILCVGAVRRQPWEYQDEIALRQVLTLSRSFDHRLVDGAEGSRFLAAVAGMLADPTAMLALS
jgi:2-oxoisovalerate dehydrogenase E2 component (dihydrolipoyl transacylase)